MTKTQIQELRNKARKLTNMTSQQYEQRRADALKSLRFETQRQKAMVGG